MPKIKISQEELCEYALEDWFVEELSSDPVKHDVTSYTVVFEKDGKFYQTSYSCSYKWGIEDASPYDAYEVEKKQVVKETWEFVKNV